VKIRDLLDGLPARRSTKIIDGRHAEGTNGQEDALTPDVLPLGEQHNGQAAARRNILVAISGTPLDRSVMTLACKAARDKKAQVFAVFGIEVPRTKAIDDEMPAETRSAHEALDQVTSVAGRMDIDIEPEIVQSRDFGHSLVDEAEAHECALLVMGLPYRLGVEGEIVGTEALDYVLRHAPCTVWVVRGQPPERAQPPEQVEQAERQPERADREHSAVPR
jgi:nucleotide-binding universal stress UspA family protein